MNNEKNPKPSSSSEFSPKEAEDQSLSLQLLSLQLLQALQEQQFRQSGTLEEKSEPMFREMYSGEGGRLEREGDEWLERERGITILPRHYHSSSRHSGTRGNYVATPPYIDHGQSTLADQLSRRYEPLAEESDSQPTQPEP